MQRAIPGVLGLLLVLTGCAGVSKGMPPLQAEAYRHHKRFGEYGQVNVHWNFSRHDGQILAEGYVDTTFGPQVRIFIKEMRLVGIDAEGRVVSSSDAFLPSPSILEMGNQGIFRVAMPLRGSEVAVDILVDYYWIYPGREEGNGKQGRLDRR